MAQGSNKRKIILISCTGVLLIAFAVVLVVILAGRKAADRSVYKVNKGKIIVTIDGTDIYENQFRFFSTLVLNQQSMAEALLTGDNIEENATVKNSTLSFAKEYIYRLREAAVQGITLTDAEREQVLSSISAEYEQYKNTNGKVYEGDAFFDYYYGLTEAQYREFWLDWALIEKYNDACEAAVELTGQNQEAAYEAFRDNLSGHYCTVISRSIEDMSEADAEVQLTLLRELKEQVENGSDMGELSARHSDDETLAENKGVVLITPASAALFPEVYEYTENAAIGDLGTVVSHTDAYLIRIDSVCDFSTLKDTETMYTWTRLYVVEKEVDDLLASGKYSVRLNDSAYNALDLTPVIDTALDQWKAYLGSLESDD